MIIKNFLKRGKNFCLIFFLVICFTKLIVFFIGSDKLNRLLDHLSFAPSPFVFSEETFFSNHRLRVKFKSGEEKVLDTQHDLAGIKESSILTGRSILMLVTRPHLFSAGKRDEFGKYIFCERPSFRELFNMGPIARVELDLDPNLKNIGIKTICWECL